MMNNKQQFSPLAALGSGAICLTVFGGTMAPLFMGVLFNNGVVYESITDEGTEYTATYVHTLPPRPSPMPEPVEIEQEPQVPELARTSMGIRLKLLQATTLISVVQ